MSHEHSHPDMADPIQDESWKIPESPETAMEISVYATPFARRLERDASYLEVDSYDLLDTFLSMGVDSLIFGQDEYYLLRDKAGFEHRLDLMDERFKPKEFPTEGVQEHELLPIGIDEDARELVLRGCSALGISVEDWATRSINLGLHIVKEQRHKSRLRYFRGGVVHPCRLDINSPKEKIKTSLEEMPETYWNTYDVVDNEEESE